MRELAKALDEEVGTRGLSALDYDLFERVARYLVSIENAATEREGADADILIAEHSHVRDILTSLFEARLKKITCMGDSDLLAGEQKIFKQVYALKKQYRKELLDPILHGEFTFVKEGFIEARVMSSIPSFLDGELHTYGPYRHGDVDRFPEEIYNILVRHGLVE